MNGRRNNNIQEGNKSGITSSTFSFSFFCPVIKIQMRFPFQTSPMLTHSQFDMEFQLFLECKKPVKHESEFKKKTFITANGSKS